MLKYIIMLMIFVMPLYAESLDEMKKRFMDEIDACDKQSGERRYDLRVQCQLKVNNKLMLLFLIEQMKESKK